MTGLFISWTRENGRTRDLARELGLEAQFIFRPGSFGLLGRYVRQLKATRELLRRVRPEQVVLMLPPAPALLSCARDARRKTFLAYDLHTGFFSDPKWSWATKWSLSRMRRLGGTAIVTNAALQGVCERAGVPAIVLHDVINVEESRDEPVEPYVLCPLSYANDEPVDEILAAAAKTPTIEWKLTGRAPASTRDAAPANVTFTGFVDDATYAELVHRSLCVVALTTRPHTMQRAGYEAFNAGVPHVTSDFPELKSFYAESAEYAKLTGASIANAVGRMTRNREALVLSLLRVRESRVVEQQSSLADLRAALGLARNSSARPREVAK